jgi:hypothetical protein
MQFTRTCSFAQGTDMIPKSWILLDTCSTSNCCNNIDLIHNLRDCSDDEQLTVHTNGGIKVFSQVGSLNLFPMSVHFDESSLANILSLDSVTKLDGVRITLDTDVDNGFIVDYHDMKFKFQPCNDGLYY